METASPTLKELNIPVFTNAECGARWAEAPIVGWIHPILDVHICVGDNDGLLSACQVRFFFLVLFSQGETSIYYTLYKLLCKYIVKAVKYADFCPSLLYLYIQDLRPSILVHLLVHLYLSIYLSNDL